MGFRKDVGRKLSNFEEDDHTYAKLGCESAAPNRALGIHAITLLHRGYFMHINIDIVRFIINNNIVIKFSFVKMTEQDKSLKLVRRFHSFNILS